MDLKIKVSQQRCSKSKIKKGVQIICLYKHLPGQHMCYSKDENYHDTFSSQFHIVDCFVNHFLRFVLIYFSSNDTSNINFTCYIKTLF